MRVLFILSLLLVSVNAFASDVYQASGVLQYQANGQPMIAKPFSIGTFSDVGSCNSGLQDAPNPSGTKVNAAQRVTNLSLLQAGLISQDGCKRSN